MRILDNYHTPTPIPATYHTSELIFDENGDRREVIHEVPEFILKKKVSSCVDAPYIRYFTNIFEIQSQEPVKRFMEEYQLVDRANQRRNSISSHWKTERKQNKILSNALDTFVLINPFLVFQEKVCTEKYFDSQIAENAGITLKNCIDEVQILTKILLAIIFTKYYIFLAVSALDSSIP